MKWFLTDGRLCLQGDGFCMTDISAELTAVVEGRDITYLPKGSWTITEDGNAATATCENFTLTAVQEPGGVLLLRTTYKNITGKPFDLMHSITALVGFWDSPLEKIMTNAYYGANGNIVNEMQTPVHSVNLTGWEGCYGGTDMLALIDRQGKNGVVGFASFREYFNALTVREDGEVRLLQYLERHPLACDDTVTTDWMYIQRCDDVRTGLFTYADTVARQMGAELKNWQTPVGFCTWYYWLNEISQDTIYDTLPVLDAHQDDLPVRYVQIDDGWFERDGDWDINGKFADGMKHMAEEIRSHGYIPGIWLSPYNYMFAEDDPRSAWEVQPYVKGEYYGRALDFSHPAARQHLYDIFHRVSHDWGYRYIKIDLITTHLAAGTYYDPTFTALKNYREGMKIIRSAVTEDTFLLGCTAPLAASVGLCDGMRVSRDIFEDWEAVKNIYNTVLKRYYMNHRWYINDSDCLIIRKEENEDGECRRHCTRNDDEIRSYVTAMAASGGILMLSDKLNLLSDKQIEMLSKLFPLNTVSALPLDLMDSFVPGILDLGLRGKTHVYALINWLDEAQEMALPVASGHAFEFWSQRYLGWLDGPFTTRVEPHCAQVIFVTEAAEATVVGVDDCIVPTIRQELAGGVLYGEFLKAGETQTVVSAYPLRALEGGVLEQVGGSLYRVTAADGAKTYRLAVEK